MRWMAALLLATPAAAEDITLPSGLGVTLVETIRDAAGAVFRHISLSETEMATQFTLYANATTGWSTSDSSYWLQPLWTRSEPELARLCSLMTTCKGFHGGGVLLTSVPSSIDKPRDGYVNLYIKK